MTLAPRQPGLHVGTHDSMGECSVGFPGLRARRLGARRCDVGHGGERLTDPPTACPAPRRAAGAASSTTRRPASRLLATGRQIAAYNGSTPRERRFYVGHRADHRARPPPAAGRPAGRARRRRDGMIGDPSGTSAELNLLDRETLETNRRSAPSSSGSSRSTAERRRDGEQPRLARGGLDARVPPGRREALHDPVHALEGLRPIPARRRPLAHGVRLHASPAADFRHRTGTRRRAPDGRADQWGNITAGPELIRRTEARRAVPRRGPRTCARVHAPAGP